MSEPKLISPLLDNYIMGDPIAEKAGVVCCPALERDLQTKCIVKIISTPTVQSQLDALLLSGAYSDAQSALEYFRTVAEGIIDEANVLHRLSQLEGFFPYIGWQLVPMRDGVGFDVYTLSEYRKTLSKLLRGDNLTHLAAVNLGLDLCTALAVCRRIGYLYVNLKSENIYLSDNNTWKIGDIGFVRLDSLKYASLPERYRSEYTAPEISDAFASLNTTLDIYALGLILYRIYNGNQLPSNFSAAKDSPLPPPDYADYEMAEIILKACDPDPSKRWQDPIEMGQALVSYMQRNGVDDTPIVPVPTAPTPELPLETDDHTPEDYIETTEDAHTETDESNSISDDNPSDETESDPIPEDSTTINEILAPVEDETAPEQNEDQLEGITVTDEVSEMLTQAEDLIAHPTPDMSDLETAQSSEASPEEKTEELTEPEYTTAQCEEEPKEDSDSMVDTSEASEVTPKDTDKPSSPDEVCVVFSDDTDPEQNATADTDDNGASVENQNNAQPSIEDLAGVSEEVEELPEEAKPLNDSTPTHSHWIRNLVIAAALVAFAALAFLFYTKYYLKSIDTLHVIKSPDGKVTISIVTEVDETELSLIYTNSNGIDSTASFQNGTAVLEDLTPGSAYTAKVVINGFHKLTGETETEFTAPAIMQIIDFNAQTGDEDGSIILSFATKDQDSEEWSISYVDDNSNQVVETFAGHSYTIYGLTVGNSYTFTLTPEDDIKYSGTTELTYTATNLIIPENLQISSIADGKMEVFWSAPSGKNVEEWIVNCYGDKGFKQTIEINTPNVVIENVDVTEAYTLEVRAAGMSVAAHTEVPANAIVITDFNVSTIGTKLSISWNSSSMPQDAWMLQYSVDGSARNEILCSVNNTELNDYIPDAKYSFCLNDQSGNALIGGQFIYETPAADKFSGYRVKASDMRFYPCKTPNKSNWSKKDLSASDYTSTFKSGEKVSFLVELKTTYNTSKESVTTLFVIRNENGEVVDYSTSTRTWTQMWYKGLCELDVPSLPTEAGKYAISIYMNGMLAGESRITIK